MNVRAENPPSRPWRAWATRWFSEPLVHFMMFGALLFAAYALIAPAERTGQRIVVNRALVDELVSQYRATWMRPPTEQQLDGLIQAYVRDEILYREGLALGLDRDDAVIKRRVRQKLTIIAEEQLARTPPSDAELSAYLAKNAERFTQPTVLSFEQIMLDNSAEAARIEQATASVREALARGAAVETLGRPTLLPHRREGASLDQVAREFGKDFSEKLVDLPIGDWVGPIASELGVHLVRVTDRLPPVLPKLDIIRKQVTREWENEQRERSLAESFRQWRDRYEVVIDPMATPRGRGKP